MSAETTLDALTVLGSLEIGLILPGLEVVPRPPIFPLPQAVTKDHPRLAEVVMITLRQLQ